MTYLIYYIIGLIVSIYMIKYYRSDKSDMKMSDLYLATIGPAVWPLQILKHLIDLRPNTNNIVVRRKRQMCPKKKKMPFFPFRNCN